MFWAVSMATALAMAGGVRAERAFEVKKDIPYYPAATYSNDFINTYCKLHLRVPTNMTNFVSLISSPAYECVGGLGAEVL